MREVPPPGAPSELERERYELTHFLRALRGAKNASRPRERKRAHSAKPQRHGEPRAGDGLQHPGNRRTRNTRGCRGRSHAWSVVLGRRGQRHWIVAQCTCGEQLPTRVHDSPSREFLVQSDSPESQAQKRQKPAIVKVGQEVKKLNQRWWCRETPLLNSSE